MGTKAQKLALTLPDYQRMHGVIASVLSSVGANTPRACLFFAVAGAYLIETFHKRPARPVVGAAFYRVSDETGFTLAFGRLGAQNDEGSVSSDENAFHCWIETQGMAIDLMAPIFRESVQSGGRDETVARKMFQRPLATMARSPFDLIQEGDFFYKPEPGLGLSLFQGFMSEPASGNLVRICENWYRPQPKSIQPMIQMGSRSIEISSLDLEGVW